MCKKAELAHSVLNLYQDDKGKDLKDIGRGFVIGPQMEAALLRDAPLTLVSIGTVVKMTS